MYSDKLQTISTRYVLLDVVYLKVDFKGLVVTRKYPVRVSALILRLLIALRVLMCTVYSYIDGVL